MKVLCREGNSEEDTKKNQKSKTKNQKYGWGFAPYPIYLKKYEINFIGAAGGRKRDASRYISKKI